MASQYDLPYTGNQVETLLGKVSELEAAMPEKVSDLQNDAGYITEADIPTDVSDFNNDAGYITNAPVTTETQRAQQAEGALDVRITAVEGKIPSAATISNKLVTDADIANFITKSVNDLANYYLKSETYTKTEVNGLIGAINQFHYEIYASISSITSPASNVLYLIGPTGSGSDKYEEYVYSGGNFVKIGDTSIDLSGYVTTTALNTALADYTTTSDLNTLLAAKYEKPSGGIPSTDIAPGVIPTVPTISMDISADGTSDTKTASPKAVKTYVDNNLPTVHNIPDGGTEGQVLAKKSDTDYDVEWVDQSGGEGDAEFKGGEKVSEVDIDDYALKDGSYDQMQVGSAKNLAGKNIVTDSFFERTTGGSAELANGIAQLKEVKGHSVAWNQLRKDTVAETTANGLKYSIVNGIIVIKGTATATTYSLVNTLFNTIQNGHKYYIRWRYLKGYISGKNLGFVTFGGQVINKSEGSTIKTAANTNQNFGIYNSQAGDVFDAEVELSLIDLTVMGLDSFTMSPQFEAWLTKNIGTQEHFPNSTGTILNNKLAGIESYGFNLLDPSTGKARIIGAYSDTYGNYYGITGTHGTITFVDYLGNSSTITPDADGKFQLTVPGELTVASAGADCAVFFWWDGTKTEYEAYDKKTEYLDVTHIYGKLNGEGNLVQVFPNGMLSAGTVKDVLTVEDGETVAKRYVGSIDLGNIPEWSVHSTSKFITSKPTDAPLGYNAICSKYKFDGIRAAANMDDKTIGSSGNGLSIIIYDSGITASSAQEIATALNGVFMNYTLATPEVYTDLVYQGSSYFADGTPVTLPVNYQVNNWGMERTLPQNTTSSVTCVAPELSIQYAIDAVEQLDTLNDGAIMVEDFKANMQALLSVINEKLGETMGGTIAISSEPTDKVYSFTFTATPENNG